MNNPIFNPKKTSPNNLPVTSTGLERRKPLTIYTIQLENKIKT